MQRLVVIGAGVMGEAIVAGVLGRGIAEPQQVLATDVLAAKCQRLQERYGVAVTHDNREAVHDADVVVLAVKPQVIGKGMAAIAGRLRPNQLLLSIAAGTTVATIAKATGHAAIVRAMPNTPGQIGQGITVWTATPAVTLEQRELARSILSALGVELYVEEERYLDMATALSGSGPAYVYLFYEALVDAGVHIGFSRAQAEELVFQTLAGSLAYLKHAGRHPAELRNQVTSPGGTTSAGLLAMEEGALRATVIKGVEAAHRRSQELGKG